MISGKRTVAASAALLLLAACSASEPPGRADPTDTARVAAGRKIYSAHCAVCHGAVLEGQPDWRVRGSNGRLPAPPHDESGHTWHHKDEVLFGITKHGLAPPYGPPGYQSDMPAFAGKLSDEEIWAVLAYIQSRWPREVMEWRAANLK